MITAMSTKRYHLGCSGWSYGDWLGKFYSQDCPPEKMLVEYAKYFDSVEINMSFYRLPYEGMVKGWMAKTPEYFIFCPKMSRKITHMKRLESVEEDLSIFIGRLDLLGEKLGPILIQLPPTMKLDFDKFESFLAALPSNHKYAIEFRNQSWITSNTKSLMDKYKVATCLVDSPKMIIRDVITADFAYVRWHGRKSWYRYEYSENEINEWTRILESLDVEEVYGYWNNDYNAYAPRNCLTLMRKLGLRTDMIDS